MTDMARTWFRFHSRTLFSGKIQNLPGATFKLLVNLWCSSALHGGRLPPLTDLAFELRMSKAALTKQLDDLVEKHLLDCVDGTYSPHDWAEWQFESDTSTERVRRHRNGKRNVSETPAKRQGNVSVTVPEAEAEAETETEAVAEAQDRATSVTPESPKTDRPVMLLLDGSGSEKPPNQTPELAAVDTAMRRHSEAAIGHHIAGVALGLYGASWIQAWSQRRTAARSEKLKHGGAVLRCLARDFAASGAESAKWGPVLVEQERREAEFLAEQTVRFMAEAEADDAKS